jgi:hypothetical protein
MPALVGLALLSRRSDSLEAFNERDLYSPVETVWSGRHASPVNPWYTPKFWKTTSALTTGAKKRALDAVEEAAGSRRASGSRQARSPARPLSTAVDIGDG